MRSLVRRTSTNVPLHWAKAWRGRSEVIGNGQSLGDGLGRPGCDNFGTTGHRRFDWREGSWSPATWSATGRNHRICWHLRPFGERRTPCNLHTPVHPKVVAHFAQAGWPASRRRTSKTDESMAMLVHALPAGPLAHVSKSSPRFPQFFTPLHR